MSEDIIMHGFAVVPGRDRFHWLVEVATFEIPSDYSSDGRTKVHDLSGFAGTRTPSKSAIFIPSKDNKPICSKASDEAYKLCAHLNSIRARGE